MHCQKEKETTQKNKEQTTMAKQRTWHGVGANNTDSLFGYGFLIRWNAKQKHYDVIYSIEKFFNSEFIITYFDALDWRAMLKDGEYSIEDLASMTDADADTYLDEVSDAELLDDLIKCYDPIDVFGAYRSAIYDRNAIKRKLNRALYGRRK